MQLKGGGPTPYCRGADGRAVLRSSIREFLAQELMHALGVPSSRSLTLYVSQTERVKRPWYSKESKFLEPDILEDNFTAITTRVAPSFLRVGQIELFSRRVRDNSHEKAKIELKMIVNHLIERNYQNDIDSMLPFSEKIIKLAFLYRKRLTSLIANWIRVGYCQGNFNSDNCALGGYTLDYGPFGFCELFDPKFQPWIGGGEHFSFLNQTSAAKANYIMFISALEPLLKGKHKSLEKLDYFKHSFAKSMTKEMESMWSKKLGLKIYDEKLVNTLFNLMQLSKADYTIFFRKLSNIPNKIDSLKNSFYELNSTELDSKWNNWLSIWRNNINANNNYLETSKKMKLVNPKYTWREWLIAPAYKKAEQGDYSEINALQAVFKNPYDDQCDEVQKKYDLLRPKNFSNLGGISHYSCSS